MDFSWSERQEELRDGTARFAAELNGNLIENDRNGVFNSAGWKKCGDFGIQGLPLPEDFGGLGMDALTTVGVLERLGYACRDNGLIFSLNAHLWTAVMPLVEFGSDEQKQRFLPGLANGNLIGGNAMSEPDAGSDAYSLRTTAERKGGNYILNGSKIYATNAPVADLMVVFATVDPSKGPRGVTAFVVEKDTPGMSVGSKLDKMGLRTSPMAEIFFDNCKIPETNRLGREGAGPDLFTRAMTWERGSILASAVGSMERLLENLCPLRQTAQTVRPADRQVPTGIGQDRRHEATARNLPPPALPHGVAAGPRQDRGLGSGHDQAPHQRQLGEVLRRRATNPRRLRLHDRIGARARTPRRPRQQDLLRHQ